MRLKPFNPERELKKLNRSYNKKHLIISLMVLIVMISIGSSYAIFSIAPQSHVIINSKVGEFSTGDIKLSVLVDGEKRDEFPAKGSGYAYEKVECENGSIGTWNSDTWQLMLSAKGPDKCTVNFKEITLINFIINEVSYQAEEGMTWGEWLDSYYGNKSFYISNMYSGVVTLDNGIEKFVNNNVLGCQHEYDIIQPNSIYNLSNHCSGGSGN